MRFALLLVLALCARAQDDSFYFEKGKVRALIVTGRNNHDWRATTPFLRKVLEATGQFDVRVTEEPMALGAESLRPYDVLIMNYCGPRWSAATEAAVQSFVQGGKGMVVVHAADYPFGEREVLAEHMQNTHVVQPVWTEWARMVGAAWTKDTGHGDRHAYRVVWNDKAHPVAGSDFLISDELYHRYRMEPGVHVLASAFDAAERKGTGKEEPLIWTVSYGKGRVFHTALGHDVAAMQAPGFVASFARGSEWAARGSVALPPLSRNIPPVRVLVVTGGHSHEASFYALFEGNRWLKVDVDPHPVAFNRDLRKSYDVVVLYDMLPSLPEAQRVHLKEFVEAGKGVVVLHHALADFGDWPWWWRETTGGLYVLQAAPDMPASTYLHDVELVVRPTDAHPPIVGGMPEMRLFDETYKQVWHAPGITPLLTTEHPTSDNVIGWIGPSKTSRVVVLQPGHGRDAHESPWFRTLVERAILWSAGRL